MPHTVFWDRPAGWRRSPFYATATFRGATATATTGPPFLLVAWELVAQASVHDDPGFATEALPALRATLDWLARERDPGGDGLVALIVPDESGLDDSPKFEPVFGRCTHDRPGYALLLERCRRAGYRAPELLRATDHQVREVLFNVAYALSLDAYARLSGDGAYAARARAVEAALLERSLDARTGLFLDLGGRAQRPVPVSTWTALAPLALPGIPDAVKQRLVAEHLLDPARYRAAVGIPSVAMDEPTFTPGWDRFRTWRGPAWVNTSWLLDGPLRALGHDNEADRIRDALREAVTTWGFREYYDPRTGRGLGARGFGWSTLLCELL